MQVFKFGGASVKNAEAVKNVATILRSYQGANIVVVISAMGKTTNLLEKVCEAYMTGKDVSKLLDELKSFHREIINDLLEEDSHEYYEVENLFIELECLLETEPGELSYDQAYDRIISFGEMISTKIVSQFLNKHGVSNRWLDARNFIVTSEHHRRARVNWSRTESLVGKMLRKLVSKQFVITQGFIGRSITNKTTTLGREGSDYSAAIFAYCLDAESVTIWKDVPGVLNADPKRVEKTELISDISFKEAIELAYYGASVIHPKTIQPLMRKTIPLHVRSFVDPEASGTIVADHQRKELIDIPCYIFKDDQVLLSISTKDFSFIVEDHLSEIFDACATTGIQINVMQNTAISFSMVLNDDEARLEKLLETLENSFIVKKETGLQLFTVFNFKDPKNIEPYTKGKSIALEHKSGKTLQLLLKEGAVS